MWALSHMTGDVQQLDSTVTAPSSASLALRPASTPPNISAGTSTAHVDGDHHGLQQSSHPGIPEGLEMGMPPCTASTPECRGEPEGALGHASNQGHVAGRVVRSKSVSGSKLKLSGRPLETVHEERERAGTARSTATDVRDCGSRQPSRRASRADTVQQACELGGGPCAPNLHQRDVHATSVPMLGHG